MSSIMREDWIEIIYENAVYKISTSKQKLKQKQYLKSGTIPIVDQGQDLIGGYTNDENRIIECDLPVLVFGAHTKITKLIDFKFAPGADGTKILEPSKFVLPEYLSIFTKVLTLKIKDNGYARHYQHIEKEFLPLAPLPVQRSIISKTEELFSDLDNGIANFKKAQEQLKIYRQAVLKKAFEGKFTNENVNKGELPNGWKWFKFKDIVNNFDGKRKPLSGEFRKTFKGEYPYYGACEIIDYVENYLFEGEYLLIGEDGANLLTKSKPLSFIAKGKFWVNNHAHIVQTKDNIDIKFLNYQFNSIHINEYVSGSAQPKLNQLNLNKIPICLPPTIEEQTQIVQEIESRLSVTDNLEFVIRNSIEKAEALRQSILKKAFEGKLLSKAEIELCKKETDYEPASELLKKITNEKLRMMNEKLNNKKPKNRN